MDTKDINRTVIWNIVYDYCIKQQRTLTGITNYRAEYDDSSITIYYTYVDGITAVHSDAMEFEDICTIPYTQYIIELRKNKLNSLFDGEKES